MQIVDKDQYKITFTDNVIYHSALQSEGYRIISNNEDNYHAEDIPDEDHTEIHHTTTDYLIFLYKPKLKVT
jgi:hypothetical protein